MSDRTEALAGLSAREASALIAARQLSPVDLVEASLERIEKLDTKIHAFVHLDAEAALREARAAEAEIAAGRGRGPLHGIPVALKDIFDVRGMPTRAGSRAFPAEWRERDATLVANLRRQGAICIGKTAMNEVSCGGLEVFGQPRNPWNLAAGPGGSSAGSAAAVASRMVPLALGGDTGGSVRVPAAFCGIVGLRPTYGLVSRWGGVPLAWSLDQPGPLARSVGDVAVLLEAISGRDPLDPATAETDAFRTGSGAWPGGRMRVGVPWDYFAGTCSSETLEVFNRALDVLRAAGASVEDVAVPSARYGRAAGWVITYVEAFSAHGRLLAEHRAELTPDFVRKVGGGACCTGGEYLTSQRIRARIRSEFLETLAAVDIIATPTVTHPAQIIGQAHPGDDPGRLARPASLTGLPALSIPCGFTAGGLPLGLQLIGRPWSEGLLVTLGEAYERLTAWGERRPPLSENGSAEPPSPASAGPAVPKLLDRVRLMAGLHGIEFPESMSELIARELWTILAELEPAAAEGGSPEPLLWRNDPPPAPG